MPIIMFRRGVAAAVLSAALLVPLTGCGGDDGGSGTDANGGAMPGGHEGHSGHDEHSGHAGHGDSDDQAATVNLTVLADMSLIDVFKQEATAYRKENPDVRLTFSFAGSQDLVTQIKTGSAADVLVTDGKKPMDEVLSKTAGKATVITRNRLVIAVGAGNPKKVTGLKDLAGSGVRVALAVPEAPLGAYSHEVLDAQRITVHPVTEEPNARSALNKVELGGVDAGIVYKTDIASASGKVDAISIPNTQNALADYPAAVLKGSMHRDAAAAFVTWLSSPDAQKVLQDAGFEKS